MATEKAEIIRAPENIAPFSLRLDVPLEGSVYDNKNSSAIAFKVQLNDLTGGILRPNQLGQLAAGFEKGRIFRHETTKPTGLYELAEGGKGITFHDPVALYERWFKLEKKVNVTLQIAMRNLIEKALELQAITE